HHAGTRSLSLPDSTTHTTQCLGEMSTAPYQVTKWTRMSSWTESFLPFSFRSAFSTAVPALARGESKPDSHPLVDGAGAHPARVRVLGAGDVHQLHLPERFQQAERLAVQLAERRSTDLVGPGELANHQLAVGHDLQLLRAELARTSQPEQQPLVLG